MKNLKNLKKIIKEYINSDDFYLLTQINNNIKQYENAFKLPKKGYVFHGADDVLTYIDPNRSTGGLRAIYGMGTYFTVDITKALDYGTKITALKKDELRLLKTSNSITYDFVNEIRNLNKSYTLPIINYFSKKIGNEIDVERKNLRDEMSDLTSDSETHFDKNIWNKMLIDLNYHGVNYYDREYVIVDSVAGTKALLSNIDV